MSAIKGYRDGFGYGIQVGRNMSRQRRLDNDRYIASTQYVQKESPTRAYWLGFRRALRML